MKIIFTSVLIVLSSCSSFKEYVDPADTPLNYTKIKSSNGETTYKRKKLISKKNQITPILKPIASKEELTTNLAPSADSTEVPVPVKALKENDSSSDKKHHVVLELNLGGGHSHFGVGYNGELGNNFDLKIGISLFSSNKIFYTGFDLGSRFKLKIKRGIEPFIGIGGYAGDTKNCTTETDNQDSFEVCEKRFLFAAYTEIGLRYKRVAIFARQYRITDADIALPVKSLWGINFLF